MKTMMINPKGMKHPRPDLETAQATRRYNQKKKIRLKNVINQMNKKYPKIGNFKTVKKSRGNQIFNRTIALANTELKHTYLTVKGHVFDITTRKSFYGLYTPLTDVCEERS